MRLIKKYLELEKQFDKKLNKDVTFKVYIKGLWCYVYAYCS